MEVKSNAVTINLIKRENDYFVTSREVAQRFGKRHRDVRRSIQEMQVSDNFKARNFSRCAESNTNGVYSSIYYLTKDGFMMLAMGFTGKDAMQWKESYIAAFNKMEDYIKEKMPLLENLIDSLKAERNILLLEQKKLPHPLKNTVIVPVTVNTLFGPEIEYKRVKRDNINYSALSYKEGELKRLSQCSLGMARKIDRITKEIAVMRRN